MFNFFKSTSENQLIIAILAIVLLIAMFYPRTTPLITAGFSAHLGNLGGKVQLEALDDSLQGKTLALFYAPWCGHCKKLMPTWDQLLSQNTNSGVKLAKINCDENPELAGKFGVESFPTIYFLPMGLNNPKDRIEYKGERSGEALLAFIADK